MKINGLNVDSATIGRGMYDIICEQGQEALIAFGMIPKEIADMLEKLLREKVVKESARQLGITPEELKPHIDAKLLQQTVQTILRECCSEIYAAAKEKGKTIV